MKIIKNPKSKGFPAKAIGVAVSATLVAGLAGRQAIDKLIWRTGVAGAVVSANGARETLVRGKWMESRLAPLDSQDSSSQFALVDAEVLIRREIGATEVMPGESLTYLDF